MFQLQGLIVGIFVKKFRSLRSLGHPQILFSNQKGCSIQFISAWISLLDDWVLAPLIKTTSWGFLSLTNFSDTQLIRLWLQKLSSFPPKHSILKIRKRLLMAREQGWHAFRAEWLATMKCVGLSRSKKSLDPEILVDRAQGRVRKSVRRGSNMA